MKCVSVVAVAGFAGVVALLAGCSFDSKGLPGVSSTSDATANDLATGSGGITGFAGNPGFAGSGGTTVRNGGTTGAGGIVASSGGTTGTGTGGDATGLGGSSGAGGSSAPDAKIDVPPAPDVPGPTLGNGALCAGDSECTSKFCSDGVCCESACGGTCMACTRAKTGQVDGQCRTVTLGADPDSECELDTDACGRTGRCGVGACELAASGKSCGDSICNGTQFTAVPRCNGTGKCVTVAATTCGNNFACKNRVCTTACATNADCAAGFDCDLTDGKCKVLLASGATCNPSLAGKDCKSGRCIDGVCCDTACAGTCSACSQAKTGQRNGLCAPVKANTDPDVECTAESPASCGKTGVCDGQGACRLHPDGTACGTGCCAAGNGGGGNNRDRVCSFVCRGGKCDHDQPVAADACGVFLCCCPNGQGAAVAACTFAANCQGGCAQ